MNFAVSFQVLMGEVHWSPFTMTILMWPKIARAKEDSGGEEEDEASHNSDDSSVASLELVFPPRNDRYVLRKAKKMMTTQCEC
jgi:hypothetical protein